MKNKINLVKEALDINILKTPEKSEEIKISFFLELYFLKAKRLAKKNIFIISYHLFVSKTEKLGCHSYI